MKHVNVKLNQVIWFFCQHPPELPGSRRKEVSQSIVGFWCGANDIMSPACSVFALVFGLFVCCFKLERTKSFGREVESLSGPIEVGEG